MDQAIAVPDLDRVEAAAAGEQARPPDRRGIVVGLLRDVDIEHPVVAIQKEAPVSGHASPLGRVDS
jgi:hypothetical protein